jgi:phosphoribosylformylglycinamidine synthase
MTDIIIHYYRKTEPPHSLLPSSKEQLVSLGLAEDAAKITGIETESCFNIHRTSELSDLQKERLEWLLAETFDAGNLRLEKSAFEEQKAPSAFWVAEFGPRMTFTSAFSSNAVSICKSCDLPIDRLEQSKRYRFLLSGDLSEEAITVLKTTLHDKMTEEEYKSALTTFDSGAKPAPFVMVPIMTQGRAALEKINEERGLGFDDFDLDYYTKLFKVRYFCLLLLYLWFVCYTIVNHPAFLAGKMIGGAWSRPYRC